MEVWNPKKLCRVEISQRDPAHHYSSLILNFLMVQLAWILYRLEVEDSREYMNVQGTV